MNFTKIMGRPLRRFLNAMGYDVVKIPPDDMPMYRAVYSAESIAKRRFYNVGAGDFYHPAWTNVDHMSDWYAKKLAGGENVHIDWDLLELAPISVEDNVAEAVYTSHTVEHITDAAAQNLYTEAYRILKPGGYLRITTPNILLDYRAYKANDRDYFYWYKFKQYNDPAMYPKIQFKKPANQATIGELFVHHFASMVSPIHADGAPQRVDDAELERLLNTMPLDDVLNHITAMSLPELQSKYPGHVNWWSKDKAFRMLRAAGFETVYESGYGQSFCPAMRNTTLFDSTHPPMSLYVEAQK